MMGGRLRLCRVDEQEASQGMMELVLFLIRENLKIFSSLELDFFRVMEHSITNIPAQDPYCPSHSFLKLKLIRISSHNDASNQTFSSVRHGFLSMLMEHLYNI